MGHVTQKEISELDYYKGEHVIPGIKFHTAGRQLGVTAWGMNVLAIDAGCTAHPEHDHVKDGQEEVYVVLSGSGTFRAEGKEFPMKAGSFVRVGPETKRKIIPGPQGIVVLALGGTPGKAYAPRT